ncbi:hypothetical protein OUZ56_031695 [Daphnia magna]|uniref:Uncharacterized protein n=1 Tax=Daphnia magna TaxID=35525 RepID=A0ABQ9ZUY3_9CRUS|nr:hypothetical protein OUZ56_031695 [Daphnia magna]
MVGEEDRRRILLVSPSFLTPPTILSSSRISSLSPYLSSTMSALPFFFFLCTINLAVRGKLVEPKFLNDIGDSVFEKILEYKSFLYSFKSNNFCFISLISKLLKTNSQLKMVSDNAEAVETQSADRPAHLLHFFNKKNAI